MLRGCLIAFVVLLIVACAGGYVAWRHADAEYGLSASEPIAHTARVDDDTRFRASLDVLRLAKYALTLIPPELKERLPFWFPWELNEDFIQSVLPRELAVLAGADYANAKLDITVFLNEQRGGPVILDTLNDTAFFETLDTIAWEPPAFAMPQRGIIQTQGTVPLTPAVEEWLLEFWAPKRGRSDLTLPNKNMLEASFDNTDGEGMAVAAALLEAYGQDPERYLKDPGIESILIYTDTARLQAELTELDEITIKLQLIAHEDAHMTPRLLALGGVKTVVEKYLQPALRRNYNIDLRFKPGEDPDWYEDDGRRVMLTTLVMTGFRPLLEREIRELLVPDAEAAETAETPTENAEPTTSSAP